MRGYYELSESSSVMTLKPMPDTSTDTLKVCPICRGSLRNLNRYNRIVRQLLLEQSTKKFIAWANKHFSPLQEQLFEEEKSLRDSAEAFAASVLLKPTPGQETNGPPILTRNRMMATSLVVRCDLAILSDFMALRRQSLTTSTQKEWVRAELKVDFSENRTACQELLNESLARAQPVHEVEALTYHARWSILERSAFSAASGRAEELRGDASQRLAAAEKTCQESPGSTRGMASQIADLRRMVRESTFYSIVDSEEKQQVYAAMAGEFSGTGHWYPCANGHLFRVGECGMPMETARCSQCGAQIGGRNHAPAEGVTADLDFERQLNGLRV